MQEAKVGEFKPFDASKWKIGVVVAQFNRHITQQLLDSALERAAAYKLNVNSITVIKVAGVVEIPLVLQHMAKSKRYNALLAIGCVIQGETPHFDYVCKFVTEGVLRVELDQEMSIGFSVLTCHDEAQALTRTHLGSDHLDAVMHQARAIKHLDSQ